MSRGNNRRPMIPPKGGPRRVNPQNIQEDKNVQNDIDNTVLCKAMDVFKADPNVNTQAAFIQQLLKARLLVPCRIVSREQTEDGKQNIKAQYLMLKNKDGENIFGVFTDWSQLKKQQNHPKDAIAIPFAEVVRAADSFKANIKGVLINPFEQGLLLDNRAIEKMIEDMARAVERAQAAGQIPPAPTAQTTGQQPAPGTQPLEAVSPQQTKPTEGKETEELVKTPGEILYIGEPLEEPYKLLKEMSKYFKGVKGVTAAYLLEIYREYQEKPDPLVVIDYKGEFDAKESVINEIKQIYNEESEDKLELTVMTAGEKLAKDAIINKKPFYTRKLFGIF